MNILILNWRDPLNPHAGGAEKLNYHILEPLVKRGDKVIWYSKRESGQTSKANYEGIQILRQGNLVTYFLALPFILLFRKFGKVDLVFDCIHGVGNLTPLIMPRTKRKVLIYEVAQNIWDETFPFPVNILGKSMERLMFLIFYTTSKFWTISKSTADDLIKMGIKNKNIEILPMGFDAPAKIKKEDKYKNPTALFVGRLVKMKGIEDAVKAISKTPNWTLKIIGRGTPQYENYLYKLVEQLDLQNRISFLGFVDEKKKFEEMSKAWVLLVPSSREGWGMIIPEANYVGTQAIGYNSPGIRDSLPYFSSKNILVENSSEMADNLEAIINPVSIENDKINAGWEDTKRFVIKNI